MTPHRWFFGRSVRIYSAASSETETAGLRQRAAVCRSAAIKASINLQQVAKRRSGVSASTRRQPREQSGGLLPYLALAVKALTRMVNGFHRPKTVEPTKETLAKRRFARGVFANLVQRLGESLFGEKIAHGHGQSFQLLPSTHLFALIDLRHAFEAALEVQKSFQRIRFDLLSLQKTAHCLACPKRNSVRGTS